MGRSPLRLALLLIPLVFACFALSPTAQAVSPAPDGGYPGGNTAEGQNALFSLTTGTYNTRSVCFRCGTTPPAASIPLSVLGRFSRTPATKTPRPAQGRF